MNKNDKDQIFGINELNDEDFKYIYICPIFIMDGKQDLGLVSKKYYIYILYLLEKEENISGEKKINKDNAIKFFKDLIETEKMVCKISRKQNEVIKKNIIKLNKFMADLKEIEESVEEIELEKKKIEEMSDCWDALKKINEENDKELEEFWKNAWNEYWDYINEEKKE